MTAPLMSDAELARRLGAHPELRSRMESLRLAVEDETGELRNADAASLATYWPASASLGTIWLGGKSLNSWLFRTSRAVSRSCWLSWLAGVAFAWAQGACRKPRARPSTGAQTSPDSVTRICAPGYFCNRQDGHNAHGGSPNVCGVQTLDGSACSKSRTAQTPT